MKIVLCADHGGFSLKSFIKNDLEKNTDIEIFDVGTFSEESVDYPNIAKMGFEKFKEVNGDYIFAFCGTGIGISIALNKMEGVYCALVYSKETAILAKEHNNANALAFGGRTLDFNLAKDMVHAFLSAKTLEGNHKRRRAEIGY